MAENKKSFILYADLINNIDHLTLEEKGMLFNHLLEYVNDMNPILTDRVVLSAWKFIQSHLKRDLVKFNDVKKKRSDAGKESARLRALKKEEQNSTKSTSVQQTSTNPTDNVNDNDNVNVNDNVNKDINTRKQEFYNSLIIYKSNYTESMIIDFYDYWSEHGEKDRKFRKEKEKSFNTELRLKNWNKRSKTYNNNNNKPKKEDAATILQRKYGLIK